MLLVLAHRQVVAVEASVLLACEPGRECTAVTALEEPLQQERHPGAGVIALSGIDLTITLTAEHNPYGRDQAVLALLKVPLRFIPLRQFRFAQTGNRRSQTARSGY